MIDREQYLAQQVVDPFAETREEVGDPPPLILRLSDGQSRDSCWEIAKKLSLDPQKTLWWEWAKADAREIVPYLGSDCDISSFLGEGERLFFLPTSQENSQ